MNYWKFLDDQADQLALCVVAHALVEVVIEAQ
jgi:hypothetical protein